ncbi:hypothetical protein AAHS21_15580 [Mycobacterium sp. 050272]|uniref:hypothetical protein n=1 Tax=Mycobacterium sp. 050272 TaxID=3142488 RepID=UPI003195833F
MASSRATRQRQDRAPRQAAVPKESKVESRELDELMGLRLTGRQLLALEWKADQCKKKSAQYFIRDYLQPVFDEYDEHMEGTSLAG